MRDDVEVAKPEGLLANVRVIWFFLKPHLGLFAILLGLSTVAGLLAAFSIASLFPLFNALIGGGSGDAGRLLAGMQTMVGALPFRSPVTSAAIVLLLVSFLKCLASWASETMGGYTTGRVFSHLKDSLVRNYVNGGYQFFLDKKQGEVVYNVYVAAWRAATMLGVFPVVFAQVMSIAALSVVLLSINPLATFWFFVAALALHLTVNTLCKKASFAIGQARKDSQLAQHVFINEFINGFKQLFVYRAVEPWVWHYRRLGRTYWSLQTKEAMVNATPVNLWEFLVFGGVAVVVIAKGGANPSSAISDLAPWGVFLAALLRLVPLISGLGRHSVMISGYLVDAAVVYRDMVNPSFSSPPCLGSLTAPALSSELRFDDVSFTHSGRPTLFDRLNMTFENEKTTALVGESGVGKTTIVNLLLGIYRPTSGRILVDGVDLSLCDLDSWLGQIGFVSQDSFIYNATIRENIAFSRASTDAEVEAAARIARAHEFIEKLPDGYATPVGERGMKLSGGQQQRLALARAILAEPRVLILDEATSSLDRLSEELIHGALTEIFRGRTVILISHRLSSIKHADKIIVLREGRVVEEGSHHELMDRRGHYWMLHGAREEVELGALSVASEAR